MIGAGSVIQRVQNNGMEPTVITGNGTGIRFTDSGSGNVVSVDTNVIATKTYVDDVVAGAGGGTTYTAGNGISIANDEISVDTTVVATKTDIAAKQDALTAGTGIIIENNVISATGGGSGSSYGDTDVANYIKNTFGMGVTEEQGEQVYYEENGVEGSQVYGDAGSNPPTTLKVRFVDNGPGEELIAEYTLEKTVIDDYTISYASENNEVTMTLSEGPSWNGTLNVPASVYQNYSYYNYKIYNPEGGTQTVYSKLNSEFIKVDNSTIGFDPSGALVAYNQSGPTGNYIEWGNLTNDVIYPDEGTILGAKMVSRTESTTLGSVSVTTQSNTSFEGKVQIPNNYIEGLRKWEISWNGGGT